MSDCWGSVEEIAEYLGLSKDTVYGSIVKKGMPTHKMVGFGSSRRTKLMSGSDMVSIGRTRGTARNDGRFIDRDEYGRK